MMLSLKKDLAASVYRYRHKCSHMVEFFSPIYVCTYKDIQLSVRTTYAGAHMCLVRFLPA